MKFINALFIFIFSLSLAFTARADCTSPPGEAGSIIFDRDSASNGLFVAVSSSGTNRIMTSPDGTTWTPRTPPETHDWFGATYGNGLFVAVASGGTNRVMTSPDGTTWTARTAAQQNYWESVTYGNGMFVAVSSDGPNRVMMSAGGITWTAHTAAEANNLELRHLRQRAVSRSGAYGHEPSDDG